MKVCYVDESGHCGEKLNPAQPVEVVCGVITDLSKLFKTQKEHGEFMDMFNERGLSVEELKAVELYRGRKEWGGVPVEVRDLIYATLLKWSKDRKCSFVICPIDAHRFFTAKDAKDPHAISLHFPWETGALNVAMAIQRHFVGTKNNKGRTFVIVDEQEKHDERLLRMFEGDLAFTDGFTGYVPRKRAKSPPRFDQIIDIPHFSKSHLSVLIQIADLAAYVVNRHLLLTTYKQPEAYVGEAQKIRAWYDEVGRSLVSHTAIDAPGKSPIATFYRTIRPEGWSAKSMREEAKVAGVQVAQ